MLCCYNCVVGELEIDEEKLNKLRALPSHLQNKTTKQTVVFGLRLSNLLMGLCDIHPHPFVISS